MIEVAKAIPGVMTKFRIRELSGVDQPAQAGARAVFMKRQDAAPTVGKRDYSADQRRELAARGLAEADGSYPIVDRTDLEHAIEAFGRSRDQAKTKAHIVARARALGAEAALPDGWRDQSGAKDQAPSRFADRRYAEADEVNEVDKVAKAMIERGAQIMKAGPGSLGPGRPVQDIEGEQRLRPLAEASEVNWGTVAAKARADLHELAKARAAKDGVSYARAYSDACMAHPEAAKLAMG
jgi:hypothetical protein